MYRKIENDSFFDDIKSQEAKDNFDYLVDYLCSSLVPDKRCAGFFNRIIVEDEILLDDYETEHLLFAKDFYSPQNLELVNEVLKNRTSFKNIDSCDPYLIDGFSYIYELDRGKIMELGTMKFYNSVAIMEHELIHILMALNNNSPQPQHTEILSFFGELLALTNFSKKHGDPRIYENALVNRCISRMSFRVFASEFSDEYMKKNSDFINQSHRNSYPYMLGFIYAIRLLNIYRDNPEEVLSNVNDVLAGKKNVKELIAYYGISLTDKKTCRDFLKFCDEYRKIVESRYSSSELCSVK